MLTHQHSGVVLHTEHERMTHVFTTVSECKRYQQILRMRAHRNGRKSNAIKRAHAQRCAVPVCAAYGALHCRILRNSVKRKSQTKVCSLGIRVHPLGSDTTTEQQLCWVIMEQCQNLNQLFCVYATSLRHVSISLLCTNMLNLNVTTNPEFPTGAVVVSAANSVRTAIAAQFSTRLFSVVQTR